LKEKVIQNDAHIKRATSEIMALKKRIDKMKSNSYRTVDIKICRKCHKEYNENANFNWSCRTHQSDFGGVMWWCCGRKNKEDPGCKFSRHESGNDPDHNNNEHHGEQINFDDLL